MKGIKIEVHEIAEPQTWGQLVRALRLKQRISYADLAERTGIATHQIKLIENDKIDPRGSTIEKLLDGLNYNLVPEEREPKDVE